MDVHGSRLAATYSIVARDLATGDLGVAVQSNYFSVGTEVSWAEPGIGAIATQSIIEVSYGPKGLALLSEGRSASEALAAMLAEDVGAPIRQVGIVDAAGRVAAHTGGACVSSCAHSTGDGYSVQGNMLASDAVWEAMGPEFEKAEGDLAERLMRTLEAAERAGGDVRGRQSAALLVVAGDRQDNSWEGRHFDLHVEDDPRPLEELRRLLTIRRAYALFDRARETMAKGDLDGAVAEATLARAMYPRDPQFAFWTGVALANAGRNDEARRWLGDAFAAGETWRELARRVREVGLYSGDPDLIESS